MTVIDTSEELQNRHPHGEAIADPSDPLEETQSRLTAKHNGATIAALRTLEEHQRAAEVIPSEHIRKGDKGLMVMRRDRIREMEEVFQPRTFEGQHGERHGLIQDLIDAINRGGVEDLGPIMVWWSGKEWFVIDGHHRLIAVDRVNAYRRNKERKARAGGKRRTPPLIKEVPVSVITGTLSGALEWATKENGKTHLTLTSRQRSNWAWRMGVLHWSKVLDGQKFIVAQQCKTLHVSERTLTTMKACWNKIRTRLVEERGGRPLDPTKDRQRIVEIAELEWRTAEKLSKGELAEDDAWSDEKRRQQVRVITEKLIRVFGKTAFSTPRAALIAEACIEASDKFAALSLGSEEFAEAIGRALSRDDPEFELEDEDDDEEDEDTQRPRDY